MGRINETVRTVNSAARTILFAALLAGAAYGGWKAYSIYSKPQQQLQAKQQELESVLAKLATADHDLALRTEEVATLSADVKAKAAAIAKLETSNGLLKLRHRIARINVLDQSEDAESGRVTTTIEFYEVDEQGAPITDERQKFEIVGDRVYVECLVAKFDDKFVEANDLDRRTAVCLFQRIFGEFQEPQDGFAIDAVGSSPTAYAGEEISEFEKGIWRDFWTIANDPARAAELGIRAAHADAPSIKLRPGGVYELDLRTTGEMTLRPLPAPPAAETAASKDAG
jgi:multidrug efflux pump subunit AcrA (membrane-fusion protein)